MMTAASSHSVAKPINSGYGIELTSGPEKLHMSRPPDRCTASSTGLIRVLLVVCLLISAGCANTPVFREGRALLPVMIAADAAPGERAAAEELARGLGLMAGLDWPVQTATDTSAPGFYLGRLAQTAPGLTPLRPAADPLRPQPGEIGPDGFRIRTDGRRVFITTATPEAAGYAVAWLLQEQGGVRWYAPGALGEVIPRRAAWKLPKMDVIREPAYFSREIYGLDGAAGVAWARRNGLGASIEFTHALTNVFGPQDLKDHPDWLPLVQGRRMPPPVAGDYNWQPNLALPAVAEHAAGAAKAAFARERARLSFSLGMNDSVRFDQSEATRALVEPLRYFRGMPDYSPLVFTFMNRAAASVAAVHPDRYLGCLAYFWCENPPPFAVHPQVLPYVTTDRAHYYDAAYRAADLELMSRWGALGVRAFGLWEYGYGHGFLVPRLPHRALGEAVREGARRGARGYFADTTPQPGFDTFKVWMLARLLWEPTLTDEELTEDFFRGYYGPAAEPMRRFFARCEAQWLAQSGPPFWLKFYLQEDQATLFPSGVCRELRALLTDAATRAAGDAVLAARVGLTSRAFAVTEAYGEFHRSRTALAQVALRLAGSEQAAIDELARFGQARERLQAVVAEAQAGENPAMIRVDLSPFLLNDPVPRLLWLAGERDPAAPRRWLAAAGSAAQNHPTWALLADEALRHRLQQALSLMVNGAFRQIGRAGIDPQFLHPRSGPLPADWQVNAMPTEAGRVILTETKPVDGTRAIRVEGAWDTQVFQWRPARSGQVYLAKAELRGQSSPGNDSALYMSFLDAVGKSVGTLQMQALPKGVTGGWWLAVLAQQAPAGAQWVGVSVGVSRQVAGDWCEARELELREATHTGP